MDLKDVAIPAGFEAYMPLVKNVLVAIAIFVGGWIASKIIARLVVKASEKSQIDTALGRFFSSIARYAVLAATVIAALGAVGVQTTSLVAIFASAGLAVGLALQGSLANFASGVMILFFRPFNLGDFVEAGGQAGTVQDIGLFCTTLITPDNAKVIVPNSKVPGDCITNVTTLGSRRATIEVGVAYGADVEKVEKVLMAAAKTVQNVLPDPAPSVFFNGLGASSLDFYLRAWITPENYWGVVHGLRQAVYDHLNKASIEIPFNQIVIHQAPTGKPAEQLRPRVA